MSSFNFNTPPTPAGSSPTASQNQNGQTGDDQGMRPGETFSHNAFMAWQMSGGDTHAAKHKEKREKKSRKKRERNAELAAQRAHTNRANGLAAADAAVRRAVSREAPQTMKAEYVENKRATHQAKKAKKRLVGAIVMEKKGEEEAEEQENVEGGVQGGGFDDDDDDLERAILEELAKD